MPVSTLPPRTKPRPSKLTPYPNLQPKEVYQGNFDGRAGVWLRISNGGAGQSGLVKALADAFINHQVMVKGREPFQVEWYLGDTTQSLEYVEYRHVDIAITYNEAAENLSLHSGLSVERVYGFRDHFMLVGPHSNPANLESNDDVLTMFNKITRSGKANPPTEPPTRFLSRFDKSATNIKESELFASIGQVPWAYAYSTWYHQYPQYPREALRAAAALQEYTLIDRGAYLSADMNVQQAVRIYITGTDDAHDRLLNPARVLRSAYTLDETLAKEFMTWMRSEKGGQDVVRKFAIRGVTLYTEAPREAE